MLTFFKSIAVAFGLYSKIPMPRFEWDSKDMRYALIFFPWIGAVIGGLLFGWTYLAEYLGLGVVIYTMIGMAIPLLVTGGFHVDGFMDTMDGIHSYGDRQKKLEILKDPHIGAFSVISLLVYVLLYLGFFSQVELKMGIYVICCMFFVVRGLSAIAIMYFKPAKSDGMLNVSSNNANKKVVLVFIIIQLVLAAAFIIYIAPIVGAVAIIAALLTFLYYRLMCYKHFGGTTGDLAGFFVTVCELVVIIAVSIATMVLARV